VEEGGVTGGTLTGTWTGVLGAGLVGINVECSISVFGVDEAFIVSQLSP
jgi:hypothetical protein